MVTRAFIAMRQAITTMLSVDLKVEQISHKVDQLNAYVEELLHDQNDINDQQEQTNNEVALQIEAINDALDQLRDEKAKPRTTPNCTTKATRNIVRCNLSNTSWAAREGYPASKK